MTELEQKQSDQVFRSAGRKAYRMSGVERHEMGNVNFTLDNPYPINSKQNKLWAAGYADERNRAESRLNSRRKVTLQKSKTKE